MPHISDDVASSTSIPSARIDVDTHATTLSTSSDAPEASPTSAAAALTRHTILEQQRIIVGLQGIVESLKAKVAALEEQRRLEHVGISSVRAASPSPETAAQAARVSALEEENVALRERLKALSVDKRATEGKLESLQEAHAALQDAHAEVLQQSTAEGTRLEALTKLSSLVAPLERRCQQLDGEAAHLREQLASTEVRRREWQALVDVLAVRADATTQSHIAALVERMELQASWREEPGGGSNIRSTGRQRGSRLRGGGGSYADAGQRRMPQPAPVTAPSLLFFPPPSGSAPAAGIAASESAAPFAWGTGPVAHAHGSNGVLRTKGGGPLARRTPKKSRYLAPL